MNQNLSYCGQIVWEHDPDRFLLSMFAPPSAREALWALFAFNHEVAKTREVVTETQLGLIRLQWWREEIGKIYVGGAVVENEVLKALAAAIRAHDLPQEEFETLIYGREFDLEDVLPANMAGTLHYADFTATPLMSLAVRVCGDDPALEPVHAVAVNYALTGLLRAIPSHARQKRCYLPQDLLAQRDIRLEKLYDLKPEEGLPAVVLEVLQQVVGGLRPSNRVLRATNALAHIYARHIRSMRGDVFHEKMMVSPPLKELRLLFGAMSWLN